MNNPVAWIFQKQICDKITKFRRFVVKEHPHSETKKSQKMVYLNNAIVARVKRNVQLERGITAARLHAYATGPLTKEHHQKPSLRYSGRGGGEWQMLH